MLWRLVCSEDASLLSTLCITALVREKTQNIARGRDSLLLEHRATRALRQRLQSGKPISDALVGTIAGLAAFSSFAGAHEESTIHFQGLFAFVQANGGIDKHDPFPAYVIRWCELYYRASHLTMPIFYKEPPLKTVEKWRSGLSPALQKQAAHLCELTSSRLPCLGADARLVLLHMHCMSIPQDPQWKRSKHERGILRSLLYDTEFKLLAILVKLKAEPVHPDRSSTAAAEQLVRYAVAEACQMFLFAALREFSVREAMYDIFVARLKDSLDFPGMVEAWVKVAHWHALVWVLFVGWVLCHEEEARKLWFRTRLLDVMQHFELPRGDLVVVLKEFPWTDEFCKEPCRELYLSSIFIL
ncbi:hypothetical protein SLS57_011933 [Botryosphaeria dothidea]